MPNSIPFWLLIIAIGVAAFSLRYTFFYIFERYTIPNVVRSILPFIPAAALSAIVSPKVFGGTLSAPFTFEPQILAWFLAMVVAWRTKNIFFTITTGLVALWVFKHYLC